MNKHPKKNLVKSKFIVCDKKKIVKKNLNKIFKDLNCNKVGPMVSQKQFSCECMKYIKKMRGFKILFGFLFVFFMSYQSDRLFSFIIFLQEK